MSKPDPILIHSLIPRNFLSFGPKSAEIELQSLNVLIGPNGSGKSNLIEAINFMRNSYLEWRDAFRRGGGIREWVWKGDPEGAASVSWVVKKRPRGDNSMPIRHAVSFRPVAQSFEVVNELIENTRPAKNAKKAKLFYESRDGAALVAKQTRRVRLARGSLDMQRSIVGQRNDPEIYPELAWLDHNYKRIRIYRDWATGPDSSVRRTRDASIRNDRLEEDFSNLGLFLSRLRANFQAKEALIEGLRILYDGLTDFEIVPEGGTVQIHFIEGKFSFAASRLSDGSLRFLCLLAILCDPMPPPLICIEEPELGLHPDVIPFVADLFKRAAMRTQIIVTTHSDILVDAMSEIPDSVLVCSKFEGQTEMERLDPKELTEWLKKYRLGQLWTKGQIGGTRW